MSATNRHLPDLSNPTCTVGTAATYSFRYPRGGWAIFTVNDATGEFHVQSDWGDYQYRWHVDHLGEPPAEPRKLTRFLAQQTRGDYVADKLHIGRPNDREEFDAEATKRALRRRVGEFYAARRRPRLDRDEVRNLLEQLDDLDWDDADSFVRSFWDHEDLELLSAEPYEWACHRPTARYTILVEALLPFFFDYLRREVVEIKRVA